MSEAMGLQNIIYIACNLRDRFATHRITEIKHLIFRDFMLK